MPKIVWDDSFSVGSEEIDEQHRKWISIINQLHDALMGHQKAELELTERILTEMVEYGRYHFVFEEQYMEKINYPDLELHRQQHQVFMERISVTLDEERRAGTILNTKVMKMMTSWLQNHILTNDKKYSVHKPTVGN